MKKILICLMCGFISLGFITGCDGSKKENKKDKEDVKESNIAAEFTEVDVFGGTLKFKQANPTFLWNSNDNFGALEIDTVFLPSENGEAVEDYYNQLYQSGVVFITDDKISTSESFLKTRYKNWYGVDIVIEDLEDELFKKHTLGESNSVRYESYSFIINSDELGEVEYAIELIIYKNDFTEDEINKLIEEYNIIIETLEVLE